MIKVMSVALVALAVGAATTEAGDRDKAGAPSTFSLGLVQKELRAGLSQAEVAEKLGSPNILTRDANGGEAWIYDRISSEVEVSGGGFGIGGLGTGGGGSFAGLLGVHGGRHAEKSRSSQRTLTVVIHFSTAGIVERFSWHHSRF